LHKERISDGLKRAYLEGRRTVRVGCRHTEDVKKRIGEASRGWKRSDDFRKKISEAMRRPHIRAAVRERLLLRNTSIEFRELVREHMWVRMNSQERKEYMRRSAIKRNKSAKMTDIEQIVFRQLSAKGVKFIYQFEVEGRFLFDFCVGDVLVECCGGYWHSLPRVISQDCVKREWAKENGFKLSFLRGEDILAEDFDIERVVGDLSG
jgi:hypothetical protein